jgi:uncharacterized membrane protein YdcZ (DUF606 family)
MFAAMIFGQLIAALLIDSGGFFGLESRTISMTRISSVCLVAAPRRGLPRAALRWHFERTS